MLTEHRPFCGSCTNKYWDNSTKQVQSYGERNIEVNKQIMKCQLATVYLIAVSEHTKTKPEPNQKTSKFFSTVSLCSVTPVKLSEYSPTRQCTISSVIQGSYDIKYSSVCYIWHMCNISISLSYIGMLGREEVARLISFSIHVSKLYKCLTGHCD